MSILLLHAEEPYNIPAEGNNRGNSGRKVRYQCLSLDPAEGEVGLPVIEQNLSTIEGAKLDGQKFPAIAQASFTTKLRKITTEYNGQKRQSSVPVSVLVSIDEKSIQPLDL